MHSAIVVTREDLCGNIQDLPFGQIDLKHFKTDVLMEFKDTDIIIFIDKHAMKIIKDKDEEKSSWVKQIATPRNTG